jgi:hypothetical protein
MVMELIESFVLNKMPLKKTTSSTYQQKKMCKSVLFQST